jgi:hypothetical protein
LQEVKENDILFLSLSNGAYLQLYEISVYFQATDKAQKPADITFGIFLNRFDAY